MMRSSLLLLLLIFCHHIKSHHFYSHHYQHHHHYGHQQCLKKICEQTISGRRLTYSRILQIIHAREYLNAIALDKMPDHDSSSSNSRKKRQAEVVAAAASEAVTSNLLSMNGNPLLMAGVPLLILSAMFFASLRNRQKETESYIIDAEPEIIYDSPPLSLSIIPSYVPKPGQPGGGYLPDPVHHHKILALVPYGLLPIAVFPSHFHYGGLTGYTPTECVIYAEPNPVEAVHSFYSYDPYRKKRKVRRSTRKRHILKKEHHYPVIEAPVYEPLFGFTCLVTVIDKKACKSPDECRKIKDFEAVYGQGYFFQKDVPPFYPSFDSSPKVMQSVPYANPLYYSGKRKRARRSPKLSSSSKGEFYSDDLPQCRIQDSPLSLECEQA